VATPALGVTARDDENKRLIAAAGGIGGLVGLLGSSKGVEAERAAGALRNLANRSEHNARLISEAGALARLVPLLSSPRGQEPEYAAAALFAIGPDGVRAFISHASASDSLLSRQLTASLEEIVDVLAVPERVQATVPSLLACLASDDPILVQWATGALTSVGVHAIPELAACLGDKDDRVCVQAGKVLWTFAVRKDVALDSLSVAIPGLVSLHGRQPGSKASETLRILGRSSAELRIAVMKAGFSVDDV